MAQNAQLPSDIGPILTMIQAEKAKQLEQLQTTRAAAAQLQGASLPLADVPEQRQGFSDLFLPMLLSGIASAVSGNPGFQQQAQQGLIREDQQRFDIQRQNDAVRTQDAFARRDQLWALRQQEAMQMYETYKGLGQQEAAIKQLDLANKLEIQRMKAEQDARAKLAEAEHGYRMAEGRQLIAGRQAETEAQTGSPYLNSFIKFQQGLERIDNNYIDALSKKGADKRYLKKERDNQLRQFKLTAAQEKWTNETSEAWMTRALNAGMPRNEVMRLGKKLFPDEQWTLASDDAKSKQSSRPATQGRMLGNPTNPLNLPPALFDILSRNK